MEDQEQKEPKEMKEILAMRPHLHASLAHSTSTPPSEAHSLGRRSPALTETEVWVPGTRMTVLSEASLPSGAILIPGPSPPAPHPQQMDTLSHASRDRQKTENLDLELGLSTAETLHHHQPTARYLEREREFRRDIFFRSCCYFVDQRCVKFGALLMISFIIMGFSIYKLCSLSDASSTIPYFILLSSTFSAWMPNPKLPGENLYSGPPVRHR